MLSYTERDLGVAILSSVLSIWLSACLKRTSIVM